MSVAWQAVTAENLNRLYWLQDLTDEEIGLMFGVPTRRVAAKRKRLGVTGRSGRARSLGDTGRSLPTSGPWLR